MTNTDIAPQSDQFAAISTSTPAPTLRITRKVRAAVDAMVWQGLNRTQAAELAGLKDNSLYVALARPDVKRYYLGQLDVLRTSERARNIHAAVEVRDQTDNQTARMQAVRWLDETAEIRRDSAGQRVVTPGVMVVVHAQRADRAASDADVIEINPAGESAVSGQDVE